VQYSVLKCVINDKFYGKVGAAFPIACRPMLADGAAIAGPCRISVAAYGEQTVIPAYRLSFIIRYCIKLLLPTGK